MEVPSTHPRALRDDATTLLAHDLKSPLSAMTMNLEFALAELPHTPPCQPVREALTDCRAAGARLFRMIANLLDVVRSEGGKLPTEFGEIDASQLLSAMLAEYADEAAARGVTLVGEASAATFEADHALVYRAFASLLDNVMRVARGGNRVVLRVAVVAEGVELSITSDHPLPLTETESADSRLGWRFATIVAGAHDGALEIAAVPDLPTCLRITLAHRPT